MCNITHLSGADRCSCHPQACRHRMMRRRSRLAEESPCYQHTTIEGVWWQGFMSKKETSERVAGSSFISLTTWWPLLGVALLL